MALHKLSRGTAAVEDCAQKYGGNGCLLTAESGPLQLHADTCFSHEFIFGCCALLEMHCYYLTPDSAGIADINAQLADVHSRMPVKQCQGTVKVKGMSGAGSKCCE